MLLALVTLLTLSSAFAAEGVNSEELNEAIANIEQEYALTCKLDRPLPETGRGVCILTDDFCRASQTYLCADKDGEVTKLKAVFSNGYGKVPKLKNVVLIDRKFGQTHPHKFD